MIDSSFSFRTLHNTQNPFTMATVEEKIQASCYGNSHSSSLSSSSSSSIDSTSSTSKCSSLIFDASKHYMIILCFDDATTQYAKQWKQTRQLCGLDLIILERSKFTEPMWLKVLTDFEQFLAPYQIMQYDTTRLTKLISSSSSSSLSSFSSSQSSSSSYDLFQPTSTSNMTIFWSQDSSSPLLVVYSKTLEGITQILASSCYQQSIRNPIRPTPSTLEYLFTLVWPKMNVIIFGYPWCHYYQSAVATFAKFNQDPAMRSGFQAYYFVPMQSENDETKQALVRVIKEKWCPNTPSDVVRWSSPLVCIYTLKWCGTASHFADLFQRLHHQQR